MAASWPTLAAGARSAIRWIKQTLIDWYRAQSFLGFTGPDAREGLAGQVEKRLPHLEGPAGG